MPLKPTPKGASQAQRREIISENIREMVQAGHPQRQAVAAALREDAASRAKSAKGKGKGR